MARARTISRRVVQYLDDVSKDMWTVIETVEEDEAKFYSKVDAMKYIQRMETK